MGAMDHAWFDLQQSVDRYGSMARPGMEAACVGDAALRRGRAARRAGRAVGRRGALQGREQMRQLRPGDELRPGPPAPRSASSSPCIPATTRRPCTWRSNSIGPHRDSAARVCRRPAPSSGQRRSLSDGSMRGLPESGGIARTFTICWIRWPADERPSVRVLLRTAPGYFGSLRGRRGSGAVAAAQPAPPGPLPGGRRAGAEQPRRRVPGHRHRRAASSPCAW